MTNDRELAYELRDACRQLLRYDGIDPSRVRDAVDRIRDIVGEWLDAEQTGDLDDD